MNNKRTLFLIGCFCAITAVLNSGELCPAAMILQTAEDLTRQSEKIFTGVVVDTVSAWTENKRFIYTDVQVRVLEDIKGAEEGEIITVRVPGGIVGEKQLRVSDTPRFFKGEEVFLFLNTRDDLPRIHRVTAMAQGKFSVRLNEATLVKEVECAAGVRAAKDGAVFTQKKERIPLADFTAEIRQIIEKERE